MSHQVWKLARCFACCDLKYSFFLFPRLSFVEGLASLSYMWTAKALFTLGNWCWMRETHRASERWKARKENRRIMLTFLKVNFVLESRFWREFMTESMRSLATHWFVTQKRMKKDKFKFLLCSFCSKLKRSRCWNQLILLCFDICSNNPSCNFKSCLRSQTIPIEAKDLVNNKPLASSLRLLFTDKRQNCLPTRTQSHSKLWKTYQSSQSELSSIRSSITVIAMNYQLMSNQALLDGSKWIASWLDEKVASEFDSLCWQIEQRLAKFIEPKVIDSATYFIQTSSPQGEKCRRARQMLFQRKVFW